jgi:hypothetical protein
MIGGDPNWAQVQEQAQKLLLELAKWMGPPSLMFSINKLNDKDSKVKR